MIIARINDKVLEASLIIGKNRLVYAEKNYIKENEMDFDKRAEKAFKKLKQNNDELK